MITELQEQIIHAVVELRDSDSEIGNASFYSKMSVLLRRDLTHKDYDDIKEACVDLEAQGVFRSVSIGSANLIHCIVPSYQAIAYKELQKLDKSERQKERIIGAFFTLVVWAIKEIIMSFF